MWSRIDPIAMSTCGSPAIRSDARWPHMSTRRTLTIAVSALLAATPWAGAQVVSYESPAGHVEILGLHRWTLQMLQDSIRHYVPGHELHDAACMMVLKEQLHFAEASVSRFEDAPPGRTRHTYLTIKLIEPQEAKRVRWDVRPRDESSSLLPDYAGLVLPITDSTGTVSLGRLLFWVEASDGRQRLMSSAPAGRLDGEGVFAFLDAHRSESDRERALLVLRRDGLWVNRMVATLVLANFAANDSTWWSLVRSLRDPHPAVRQAAGIVLRSLPRRVVDWRPAATDLRLLLGGRSGPWSDAQRLDGLGIAPLSNPPLYGSALQLISGVR